MDTKRPRGRPPGRNFTERKTFELTLEQVAILEQVQKDHEFKSLGAAVRHLIDKAE